MNNTSSMNRPDGYLPSVSNPSSSSILDAVVGERSASSSSGSYDRSRPPPAASSAPAAGKGEDMTELERNLQKRKSLIPHLENELAELEAQIKAAEERLARAAQAPAASKAQ